MLSTNIHLTHRVKITPCILGSTRYVSLTTNDGSDEATIFASHRARVLELVKALQYLAADMGDDDHAQE